MEKLIEIPLRFDSTCIVRKYIQVPEPKNEEVVEESKLPSEDINDSEDNLDL